MYFNVINDTTKVTESVAEREEEEESERGIECIECRLESERKLNSNTTARDREREDQQLLLNLPA